MVVEEIPILKDIIADNQKLIDEMTDKLEAIKKILNDSNMDAEEMLTQIWITSGAGDESLGGS